MTGTVSPSLPRATSLSYRVSKDRAMKNYIVIDGGTTNTRINLVRNGSITDTLKLQLGQELTSAIKAFRKVRAAERISGRSRQAIRSLSTARNAV
jgi:2-keto-3-deoxy-galactonokinase